MVYETPYHNKTIGTDLYEKFKVEQLIYIITTKSLRARLKLYWPQARHFYAN